MGNVNKCSVSVYDDFTILFIYLNLSGEKQCPVNMCDMYDIVKDEQYNCADKCTKYNDGINTDIVYPNQP